MISLQGSLRTCKVNTGYANRMNSERFENSDVMVCPVWNGHDLAGRPVCADSYATKLPGCNVASDRVVVENAHRPVYSEYIQLNTKGLEGPKYGSEKFQVSNSRAANKATEHFSDLTGSFGMGPNKSQVGPSTCNNNYQHSGNVSERYNENAQGCSLQDMKAGRCSKKENFKERAHCDDDDSDYAENAGHPMPQHTQHLHQKEQQLANLKGENMQQWNQMNLEQKNNKLAMWASVPNGQAYQNMPHGQKMGALNAAIANHNSSSMPGGMGRGRMGRGLDAALGINDDESRENYIENMKDMEKQASKQADLEVQNMQAATNKAVENMRFKMMEKMNNMKQRSNAVKERMQNTMNGLRK